MNANTTPAPWLDSIHIVLVGTTHPGNIGAAARAMKNMGLRHLRLVAPRQFPCQEATARASGADDILAEAAIFTSLAEAVADCRWVIGSSARSRSIQWPTLDPQACAVQARDGGGKVALLFGREHSGLSNEELDFCQFLLHIPTNPEFSSLNVAAAVQLICYELRMLALEGAEEPASPVDPALLPVSNEEMTRFYAHLEQTLVDLEFLDPEQPKRLLRRLHRLFNRAQPSASEMNILRGILGAAQKAASGKLQKQK